jgi:hypothetical protein
MATWNKVDELTFDKELIPVGEHVKWLSDDKEEQLIVVNEDFIDQKVADFNKFQEVGTRVPVFVGHDENPDLERGLVKKVFKAPNDKGIPAFFSRVRFHDKKAAEQGTKNDVSMYLKPQFKDSKGNRFSYPLMHVALTSKPVISGLGGFEPVVLAFDSDIKKVTKMDDILDDIAAKLGITFPEGSDTEAKLRLILQAIPEGDEEETEESVELSFPPMMLKQMTDARKTVISGLITEHVVTPAHGEKLTSTYCTPEAIKVDLKLDSTSGETEFDRTVENLREARKAAPLPKSGRGKEITSEGQPVKLGRKDKDDEDSPLVRNMKKRAERAKPRS